MHTANLELLRAGHANLKFILNDNGIVFFPATQQHRDIKTPGISYEDEYRGNAVAGLVTQERIEIRFHKAFSDEHIKNIWIRVLSVPEIAQAGLAPVYYQGRAIT